MKKKNKYHDWIYRNQIEVLNFDYPTGWLYLAENFLFSKALQAELALLTRNKTIKFNLVTPYIEQLKTNININIIRYYTTTTTKGGVEISKNLPTKLSKDNIISEGIKTQYSPIFSKKKSKLSTQLTIKNILKKSPQKKGIIVKILILKPKKPNSANRKIAKVKINNNLFIRAYIPGEGHSLHIHNNVLIRGGKTKDLPGINYKIIRGALDCVGVLRSKKRSKYGCKKPIY